MCKPSCAVCYPTPEARERARKKLKRGKRPIETLAQWDAEQRLEDIAEGRMRREC